MERVINTPPWSYSIPCNLGDLKRLAVQHGFDVDKRGAIFLNGYIRENATILWAACAGGQLETVQYLMTAFRPDVNAVDDQGCSVFWATCYGGNLDVVKLMESRGATYAQKWITPLSAAFESSCVGEDVFSYLISKKHDVNARLLFNRTALHVAALKGYPTIVEMLINAGAKELKDDSGSSPIETAAAAGNKPCFDAFIKLRPHEYSKKFVEKMKILIGAASLRSMAHGRLPLVNFSSVQAAYNELHSCNGDMVDNYPPVALLNAAQIHLMETGRVKEMKQALLIYQQILGMGNPFTISAFREYLYLKGRACNNEWLFLFDSLSKNFKPLDEQLIISLRSYISRSIGSDIDESKPDILNILLGEVIRGYRIIRKLGNPSWYSDQCHISLTSNFDQLLRLFLQFLRNSCRFANPNDRLEVDRLPSWVWLTQNSIRDSKERSFIQLWLADAVEETDHSLLIGLLTFVSELHRDDLFAFQDWHGRTVLDEAICLKQVNAEIISYLLEHSAVQPKITQQLFTTIENLKNINRADVAVLLRNRVPITVNTVVQLCAVTDDLSTIIEFAETISDKPIQARIAAACLERNKLPEAMKLFLQCKDFTHHSKVFEIAMKDDGSGQWDLVVKFFTCAVKTSKDPEVQRELQAGTRMAALAKQVSSKEGSSSSSAENNTCDLCFDQEKDVVFVPCGHMSCCQICSEKVSICPFCSKAITNRQRFFRT